MTLALILTLTGALQFVERTVEDIGAGRPNPLTGETPVNFRHADVNGDGYTDLLLSDRVMLQRNRDFPAVLSTGLPALKTRPDVDVWDGALYARQAGLLEIYRLRDMRWEREMRQSISWPDLDAVEERAIAPDQSPTRFLHDLSGDGEPEIVVPASNGLWVYARDGQRYTRVGVFDVFPQRKALVPDDAPLWPERDRRVGLPTTYLGCRIYLDSDAIYVLSRGRSAGALVTHRALRWQVNASGIAYRASEYGAAQETQPLPPFLHPCRLNADSVQDYAGVQSHYSEASLVPERIYEIAATTDGGKTVQRFRTKSFSSLCSFTDLDRDGDRDLIIESTGLYDGGPREYIARSLSERRVRHTIRTHHQDSAGKFSRAADGEYQVTLEFSRVPGRDGPLFRAYRQGTLVNVTGDVNGDGKRDLVARTHPNRVAVFLGDGTTFSRKPDAVLSVELETRFSLSDVDGDGRSDILVQDAEESSSRRTTTVHFAIEAP